MGGGGAVVFQCDNYTSSQNTSISSKKYSLSFCFMNYIDVTMKLYHETDTGSPITESMPLINQL